MQSVRVAIFDCKFWNLYGWNFPEFLLILAIVENSNAKQTYTQTATKTGDGYSQNANKIFV